MTTDQTGASQPHGSAHRSTFFRQSGWLMIANVANGFFMVFVHFLSKKIPESEYGIFGTMLALAMCVPMIPMQMVLAQQTAHALATNRLRELAGTIRMIWIGTFVLCLAGALVALMFQAQILERWSITNPMSFWITLPVILLSLWFPMFCGVLQGQQNFMWLGWSMIFNGVGRLAVATLAVMVFAAHAAGMMAGVLMGLAFATSVALWHSRSLWMLPPLPCDKRAVLSQVIPLMLGFGAFQFLFTADTMFVKAYFNADETGFYVAAGTMSRALMWLVTPLAMVMFPKIVHSTARSQESDLMVPVLLGTGALAAVGAVGLWVIGPFAVRLMFKDTYVNVAASVLPWYALAMLPLAMANVLLNNLLARSSFKIVPFLVLLAVGYGWALTRFHDTLTTVLKTMGVCNLLLLALCVCFTWCGTKSKAATST